MEAITAQGYISISTDAAGGGELNAISFSSADRIGFFYASINAAASPFNDSHPFTTQ
jgi:hypothetical protein